MYILLAGEHYYPQGDDDIIMKTKDREYAAWVGRYLLGKEVKGRHRSKFEFEWFCVYDIRSMQAVERGSVE